MKRRKMSLMFGGIAGVLLLAFVGFSVEICHLEYYVCRNTLSTKGHKTWWFGIESGHWYRKSPLEEFLAARGEDTRHEWKRPYSTGKNIYWMSVSFNDGAGGELTILRRDELATWMERKTDKEILDFAKLLKGADREKISDQLRAILSGARVQDEDNSF